MSLGFRIPLVEALGSAIKLSCTLVLAAICRILANLGTTSMERWQVVHLHRVDWSNADLDVALGRAHSANSSQPKDLLPQSGHTSSSRFNFVKYGCEEELRRLAIEWHDYNVT